MKLDLFQVDAFASGPFSGNPAAVVPLDAWLPDEVLQGIALENQLSETAYVVPENEGWHLRWFTPKAEVRLCGHATLASAHVVLNHLRPESEPVRFRTLSGVLEVRPEEDRLTMDLPTLSPGPAPRPDGVAEALGAEPVEILWSDQADPNYLAIFEREEQIRALRPDMDRVLALGELGVIASAPGKEVDFVSRYFAPFYGVPEDPATGSVHATMTPYWAERLGRRQLRARQISERVGEFWCEDRGERVRIGGRVRPYLVGRIEV